MYQKISISKKCYSFELSIHQIWMVSTIFILKGSSDSKYTLHVVWTSMCVGSVCTHPPYNDKNPPSVFFFFKSPFSNQAVLRFLSEWRSSAQATPTIVDWQDVLPQTRPEWSESCPPLVQGKTRCLRLSDWGVLLLDVIMNIAVVIYSRHLSRWRCRGLTLLSFLKGMRRSRICLMFTRIIRDPASHLQKLV